jgi:hypothetical protein
MAAQGMTDFQAGFGLSDITPPVGLELEGFGCFLGRKSTGIMEPLKARSMAWRSGEGRGLVVACDLIEFGDGLVDRIRSSIAPSTGIPCRSIMVCASHTHSGPATIGLLGWGERDPGNMAGLPDRIAESARGCGVSG